MATAREAAVMAGKVEFVEKQVGIQGNRIVTILEVRYKIKYNNINKPSLSRRKWAFRETE
jgi:hypothetical protein